MQAGKLLHRVRIENPPDPDAQDAAGEPDTAWTTFLDVYAAVHPLNGRELIAAREIYSEVTYEITIRYREGVNAKQRITWRGRIFVIGAVINDEERNIELKLLCSEGLTDGG